MRKWVIAGLIILVGISLAVISVISLDLRDCRRDARLELGLVQSVRDSLFAAREQLKGKNAEGEHPGELGRQEARELHGEHTYLLDKFQIKTLKARGLSDPVSQLPVDLMAHPELIPFKGVVGGTMGFYTPEVITILSPSWVFARFDDGHVMGSCLLEYEISPDTTIHWRLIKAQMDE
jgi:hypothetical protein